MDRTKLAELLNEDLAYELQAVQNYLFQHATAKGMRGLEFREIIEPEIADELGHAKFLADKVVALGGTPKMAAKPFDEKTDVEEMVRYDLELEREAISRYRERVEQAREVGEDGLAVRLEDMIADETEHKELFERILEGSTNL